MGKETKAKSKAKENEIFIGKKYDNIYATAVATLFNKKEFKEITVKARGRDNIGKAINSIEMARNRFVNGISYGKINIKSEEMENKEGKKVNIASIEIQLKKK